MRLRRLRLKGLTRFVEPVSIDFDGIGPGLVAIVGENGSGKTTILESVPAALHGRFPSRPRSLYEYATGRDAFVEAAFEDDLGAQFVARVLIDTKARATEGYLERDGEPLARGKVKEYRELAERVFGTRELLLASVFAAQNRAGDFLGMRKGERKALFVELLGLARLQELHAKARERRGAAELGLAEARGKAGAVAEAEEKLADVQERVKHCEREAERAERELDQARDAEREAAEQEEQALAADAELAGLRETVAELEGKVAAARAEEGKAQIALKTLDDEERSKLASIRTRDPELERRTARAGHGDAVETLDRREAELNKVVALTQAATEAQAEARRLEGELEDARSATTRREIGLERLKSLDARLVDDRARLERRERELRRRSELIGKVPCGVAEGWFADVGGHIGTVNEDEPLPARLRETCPLLADAREAGTELEGMDVEKALEPLQQEIDAVEVPEAPETDPRALEDRLREARALAGRLTEIARAEDELVEVRAERERADLRLRDVLAEADVEASRQAGEVAKVSEWRALQADARRTLLDQATAARERLREELEDVRHRLEEAGGGLRDLAAARMAREAAREAVMAKGQSASDANAARGRAVFDLEDAERALDRAREDALRIAACERHLDDWSLLEAALGPDGVQALEVDAAGPQVARIVNDLLSDSPFAVGFETLREKRGGGHSEAFDVAVAHRGRPCRVEDLSGGERVFVGEAIGLGLAIFNRSRGSVTWRTLFRDETAGALDPENAARYVAMLRRALEVGGFRQCVFVAHLPQVYEAADARVNLRDGRAEVD